MHDGDFHLVKHRADMIVLPLHDNDVAQHLTIHLGICYLFLHGLLCLDLVHLLLLLLLLLLRLLLLLPCYMLMLLRLCFDNLGRVSVRVVHGRLCAWYLHLHLLLLHERKGWHGMRRPATFEKVRDGTE